jgi:hypothetical protein
MSCGLNQIAVLSHFQWVSASGKMAQPDSSAIIEIARREGLEVPLLMAA